MLSKSATTRLVILALTLAMTGACGSNPGVFDPGDYDFAGRVTALQTNGEFLEARLVADPASAGGERIVRINSEAQLFRRDRDGVYRPVSETAISIGTLLRVKTTGIEIRTLPPQYYAVWVEVIPDPT